MAMNEDQRKHLDFIQAAIIRMAACSFQLKGWNVTLVAAILAIIASSQEVNFLLPAMGLVPALIFAFLDATYLKMERQYVKMYEDAVSTAPKLTLYYMRPTKEHKKDAKGPLSAFFSWSVGLPHVTLLIVLIGLTVVSLQWPEVIAKIKAAVAQMQEKSPEENAADVPVHEGI
jgi:hypothetical protein